MTDEIALDRDLARKLLASEALKASRLHLPGVDPAARNGSSTAQIISNGEHVLQQLNEHLLQWFGLDGVEALLLRALNVARRAYPVLDAVRRNAPGSLSLSGIAECTASNDKLDGSDVVGAIEALVATIVALIGRLVGDDMTRHLVEQIWPETSSDRSLSNKNSNNVRLDK